MSDADNALHRRRCAGHGLLKYLKRKCSGGFTTIYCLRKGTSDNDSYYTLSPQRERLERENGLDRGRSLLNYVPRVDAAGSCTTKMATADHETMAIRTRGVPSNLVSDDSGIEQGPFRPIVQTQQKKEPEALLELEPVRSSNSRLEIGSLRKKSINGKQVDTASPLPSQRSAATAIVDHEVFQFKDGTLPCPLWADRERSGGINVPPKGTWATSIWRSRSDFQQESGGIPKTKMNSRVKTFALGTN